jgi:two-component system sensor histidine kinase BaeS
MLDATGQVIVDSAAARPPRGTSLADRPEVRTAIGGRYGGYMRHTPEAPDNRLSMYVALPVTRNGRTVGVVYLSSTLRHITRFLDEARRQRTLAIVAALLLGGIASLFLARAFSRPVRDLESAAQRLAQGDWRARARVYGRDELAQLARSFNAMADRLADLERLRRDYLGDLAHELRTPLTAIRGYAETLLETDDPAVRRRFLERIAAKTDQMTRLVGSMLDLARLEASRGQVAAAPVSVPELIEDAVETFRLQAQERGVRVAADVAPDLPLVRGDQDRLAQALGNLVANALAATPPGGEVIIRAQAEAEQVTIEVADTGRGIPAEALPHIFDRFYRVPADDSSPPGGSGLGLAIVKEIAAAHGGTISVQSDPGRGSSFRLILPVA